jgi:hypothetical protein
MATRFGVRGETLLVVAAAAWLGACGALQLQAGTRVGGANGSNGSSGTNGSNRAESTGNEGEPASEGKPAGGSGAGSGTVAKAGPRAPDTAEVKALIEAAGFAHRPPGFPSDEDVQRYGKACVTAADAVLKSGVSADADVELPIIDDEIPGIHPVPDKGGFRLLSVGNVRAHICVKAVTKGFVGAVYQTASRTSANLLALEQPDKVSSYGGDARTSQSIIVADMEEAKQCQARIAEALAYGVPATTMVDFANYGASVKGPMSLADTRDKLCKYTEGAFKAQLDKVIADEKAAYAPYLAVLTGDKKRMFWDDKWLNYRVRGHGGRVLGTPADFRDSDVWYQSGLDLDKPFPEWHVWTTKFSGDKSLGTTRTGGIGADYPANAFP